MQRIELLKILQKTEELFYGTLGTWEKDPVDSGLKKDVKPNPLPNVQKEMSKEEVECLFLLRFHERTNDSEWRSPYFEQPKPKTNRL